MTEKDLAHRSSKTHAAKGEHRIAVLLPLALPGSLDYRCAGEAPKPGTFVRVPLMGRSVVGVVWDTRSRRDLPLGKLKAVEGIVDVPPLSALQRKFITWVSEYTLAPLGTVLKMSMSAAAAFKRRPTMMLYRAVDVGTEKATQTPSRLKVLSALEDGVPRTVASIAKRAGVGEGVVRALIQNGTLTAIQQTTDQPYPAPDPMRKGPQLNDEQKAAADRLVRALNEGFSAIALQGITGSGKTEVYFEALAAILKSGTGQIVVLLPEIALTAQWLERFEARFGERPVQWHSNLGDAERRRAWLAVAVGGARVVVGARSALFLPFRDLRLVVVDEEHDPSFKQEEGVTYQARDMAVKRAQLAGCLIVLSSATPSYETLVNIERGKYVHLTLSQRYGGASLPEIIAVDMRAAPPSSGRWLAPALVDAMRETMARHEQIMLFLNRRGYAPLTLCRRCGSRLQCPNCTAWLVEHRLHHRLMCHHCGHSIVKPKLCPSCHAEDSLAACGPGVERLEEEVAEIFPQVRRLVMTSDTLINSEHAMNHIARIARGSVDVVIGTQVITKGHHFPKLTLVGVVDADLGLKGGDVRAAERTYQQLEQVAGRAGRERRQGRVMIQTYMPEEPVMAALLRADKEAFIRQDLEQRKLYVMPPFGRLAAILVTGDSPTPVEDVARTLARTFPATAGVELLGPAPAPLARLKGRFRYRLLLKTSREQVLQPLIRRWLGAAKISSRVTVKVDIDPYNFL